MIYQAEVMGYGLTPEQLPPAIPSMSCRDAMKTEDVINTFAVKTDENSADNALGFSYGFLDTYAGYHTK